MIRPMEHEAAMEADLNFLILEEMTNHSETIHKLKETKIEVIAAASKVIATTIKNNRTVYWCGNGGSASDSQHMAAEFIGRFKKDRQALRSMALTADSSVISCIANDYGYEQIFSRQLEAFGEKGDTLIAISTSGNSRNVIKAIERARSLGIKTICLLGKGGGEAKRLGDICIAIDSDNTARIQECHELIGHIICSATERILGLS